MNEQVQNYIEKYTDEVISLFKTVRQLIFDSTAVDVIETLWAKIPSYYVGEQYVRLIPFKDHINIEAQAVVQHREELADYKITPKGMMQIFVKQAVPLDVLKQIFSETLV